MKTLLLFVLGAIHGVFVQHYLGFNVDTTQFWFYSLIGSAVIYFVLEEIDEQLQKK